MKKGDDVTMLFHCAGVVSEESEQVDWVSEDGSRIRMDNGFEFNTATGQCLNDETMFDCRRELKEIST